MNQTQPSLNADDDRDSKATEALEAARLMPAGKEKSEALKRAGLLRKARSAAGRRSTRNGV